MIDDQRGARPQHAGARPTGSKCRVPGCSIGVLPTVDPRDAVLTHPIFGPLPGQRAETCGPGQRALDAVLLDRTYRLRMVETADRHADAAALDAVPRERSAAGAAKAALCDIGTSKDRGASARPP